MKVLRVLGGASKKIVLDLPLSPLDDHKSLMDVLLREGIPVASSCGGEGICYKCTVNYKGEKILSCQKKIKELIGEGETLELTFSYL